MLFHTCAASAAVVPGGCGVSGTPAFAATPTRLWWSEATLWNNSEDDDAFLYSCSGALVSTFEDGD